MEQVLSGLYWKTLLIYLDGVIVISPDFDTHVSRLREVFDRLRAADLKLKPSKCGLSQQEVKYLGHLVGRDGVATDPEKVRAVSDIHSPYGTSCIEAKPQLEIQSNGSFKEKFPLYYANDRNGSFC